MSRIFSTCAECGRTFQDYDAAPRLWCSAYCETQPARFAATEARGAAAERAAVVAWLRAGARNHRGFGVRLIGDELEAFADSIERGEHREHRR